MTWTTSANFFHKLLVLWINADVSTHPQLLDDVVIRFDIQLDSFRASTNSAIAIRWCRCFASCTQAPHSRIIGSKIAHRPSKTSIIAFCSIMQYPASIDQSTIRSEFSRLAIDQLSTCFQIRMIDQSSTHFQISPPHSQTYSTRLPGLFGLENYVEFGYLTPFGPDPLTSGVQRSPAQSTRLVLNQSCCCCNC